MTVIGDRASLASHGNARAPCPVRFGGDAPADPLRDCAVGDMPAHCPAPRPLPENAGRFRPSRKGRAQEGDATEALQPGHGTLHGFSFLLEPSPCGRAKTARRFWGGVASAQPLLPIRCETVRFATCPRPARHRDPSPKTQGVFGPPSRGGLKKEAPAGFFKPTTEQRADSWSCLSPPLAGGPKPRGGFGEGSLRRRRLLPIRRETVRLAKDVRPARHPDPSPKTPGVFGPPARGGLKGEPSRQGTPCGRQRGGVP